MNQNQWPATIDEAAGVVIAALPEAEAANPHQGRRGAGAVDAEASMPRLTADTWETIRAEREAGSSFLDLAAKFGVSHTAIIKRAKAGSWGDGQDVSAIIRRKVSEKVSSIVSAGNPQKRPRPSTRLRTRWLPWWSRTSVSGPTTANGSALSRQTSRMAS